ncbi:hypothetical protein [uncultured Caulobacter sp.]|uniref:hypothetical protein n=1 Tax=uncultured Caulobacter sp. TaxID=158749 RepID=UPI0026025925|nr:hypothetical protein [uncultured Caulobacter sp.]
MELIQLTAGRSLIVPVGGVGMVRAPTASELEAASDLHEVLSADNAKPYLISSSLVCLVRRIAPRHLGDFRGSPPLVERPYRLTTIEHRRRHQRRWIEVRGHHQAVWRWQRNNA